MSEIGDQLVVVHGQSDQIRLRSAVAQREALDQFAGEELAKVMTEYTAVFEKWKQAATKLSEITTQLEARSREADQIR